MNEEARKVTYLVVFATYNHVRERLLKELYGPFEVIIQTAFEMLCQGLRVGGELLFPEFENELQNPEIQNVSQTEAQSLLNKIHLTSKTFGMGNPPPGGFPSRGSDTIN
jgi:hypothetical protein